MSASLSNAFIASFDADVKQQYQMGSMLKDTVRVRSDVEGSTHRFPKLGKGSAVARGTASADLVPVGYTHSNATATLADWVAPEYSDVFDLEKINFDEKAELAMAIGMSLGRRLDQIVISAITAGISTASPDHQIEEASSGLTLAKIISASTLLNAQGVPMMDRCLAVSAKALEDALGETKITSADYNTMRALVAGDVDNYMGFGWKMIEDRAEGGLDLTSTTRTCLAYHKSAAGLAIGMEPKTEMNYVPHKISWLITGMLSAGAVAIEDTGIVGIQVSEA